ncbi:hypothetical protein C4E24_00600 [ANME-1 cluster archaeon AG-394-G21]|nr:hypothetical protein [ANME-1 cluster archaeon AG-394-G21]
MLHLISMLQDPFENFTGIKFVFFHHFANRALIPFIFRWKSTKKFFFTDVSRECMGGGVVGAAEEIIPQPKLAISPDYS